MKNAPGRVMLGGAKHHKRYLKPVRARRSPARGSPTLRGGSTSPTTRSYIAGPPLAAGLGRP